MGKQNAKLQEMEKQKASMEGRLGVIDSLKNQLEAEKYKALGFVGEVLYYKWGDAPTIEGNYTMKKNSRVVVMGPPNGKYKNDADFRRLCKFPDGEEVNMCLSSLSKKKA